MPRHCPSPLMSRLRFGPPARTVQPLGPVPCGAPRFMFIISSQGFCDTVQMTDARSLWRLVFSLALLSGLALSGCAPRYAGPRVTDEGVVFSLKAPGASRVVIVGSFNKWDRERDLLSGPDSDGMWRIVLPLGEGRYEYLFLVDGEKWLTDPAVPKVKDGFGGENSVISVRR